MNLYNTFAGALMMSVMLLIGSGVVFIGTRLEQAFRSARGRASARQVAKSALGIALFVGLWLGFGHLSFSQAFDSTHGFVPREEVRWRPVGAQPTTSFDRFDYGSASNAEISRRS
jgi:hypothetical protein